MTSAIVLAVGNSQAASLVAKATVTLVLALVGVWFARRSSAAVRHVILAAAFAMLLALPSVHPRPISATRPGANCDGQCRRVAGIDLPHRFHATR